VADVVVERMTRANRQFNPLAVTPKMRVRRVAGFLNFLASPSSRAVPPAKNQNRWFRVGAFFRLSVAKPTALGLMFGLDAVPG